MHISIIIPARNEQFYIPGLLDSIGQQLMGSGLDYEVLLADNGSTDRTSTIAQERGAISICCGGLTVGGARNRAAARAAGELLVFLDADMILRNGWCARLSELIVELREKDRQIIGGSLAAPPEAGWIGRAWFPNRRGGSSEARYVGSGHMIVPRRYFEALGGFNVDLRTSEDYDLCIRARQSSGRIRKCSALAAYHRGVPRTPAEFFRRELWHGSSGDVRSVLGQRVSWLAILWFFMHLGLLGSIILWGVTGGLNWAATFLLLGLGLVGLVGASSLRHGGLESWQVFGGRCLLYPLYYWARITALFSLITSSSPAPSMRLERK